MTTINNNPSVKFFSSKQIVLNANQGSTGVNGNGNAVNIPHFELSDFQFGKSWRFTKNYMMEFLECQTNPQFFNMTRYLDELTVEGKRRFLLQK